MKYAAVAILLLIVAFPMIWMLWGSTLDIWGILAMPPRLSLEHVTLKNYYHVIVGRPVFKWCLNTLKIWVVSVVLSVLATFMAGFAFSIYDFKGQRVLFWLFLLGIIVPYNAMIIPLFVTVKKMGIGGTWLAAVAPNIFWPVGMLICRDYIDRVPRSMFDAGMIEGASDMRIITQVYLPLCKPLFGALVIFRSIRVLTDFLWQMLNLQADAQKNLLVGLMFVVMRRGGDSVTNINPIGQQLAVGTLLAIPIVIIFAIFQRYFIHGIISGVKE
uniref:Putative transporter domain contining protein n=2 Tax=viral metagenome TaxID=1070528 RepID=A0A6M3JTQ4_9ZZZZ